MKFIRYFLMEWAHYPSFKAFYDELKVGEKMKFIRYFLMEWAHYPSFKAFYDERPQLKQHFIDKGEKFPKSRFHFAFEAARARWKHRDMYSRKCTGNCEQCKLKHC